MGNNSHIISTLFSYLNFEYFLFCAIGIIGLYALRYHIHQKSSLLFRHLKGFESTISTLLSRNTRMALVSLTLVFIGELFILQLAMRTEQNRLMVFVTKFSSSYTESLQLHGHEHLTWNTPPSDPVYQTLMYHMKHLMNSNDIIISMYTLRQDANGKIRFILAPETDYNKDGKISGELEEMVKLGEPYEEEIPEISAALRGESVFQDYVTEDKWGESISIFLPIKDPSGKIDAILGIDFNPNDLMKNIQPIQYASLIFGLFAMVIILVAYYFITFREISQFQTNYFIEKLNTHHQVLEAQVEEEVIKRQEKERILAHQARLATMGEMIANITHQWRQPLTAISNIVQEMQDAYKYNELNEASMQENTRNIRIQLNQMSTTIDDFRNFFSPSKTVTSFYAKDQIKTTLSMLKGMLQKNNISVDLYIDGDTTIKGYANEYNHVLINILNNARDIFIERAIESPRLIIRVNEEESQSIVTISDNAGGIPTDLLDKIFDPYFTTKGEQHGTGIGLYMCKQIIENNMNGQITAHNSDDGAVFTITI